MLRLMQFFDQQAMIKVLNRPEAFIHFAIAGMLYSALLVSCQAVELEVKEGECKGAYALYSMPAGAGEYPLESKNRACEGAVNLIYDFKQKKDVTLEFWGIEYRGKGAPGASNGLVLSLNAPRAARVTGIQSVWNVWAQPFYRRDLKHMPRNVQFLLWQYPNGEYGAMIPLVGGGMRCLIGGEDGRLKVSASSNVSGFIPSRIPVLAASRGKDVYQVVRALYEYGMDMMGNPGKLRVQKEFPPVFEYLGWCSFNAHFLDLSEEKILAHAQSFKAHNFPVGFILIDEGWQSIERPDPRAGGQPRAYLMDFEADRTRFPGGLARTVKRIKETGVRHVGVWHACTGYWWGVFADSDLARREKDALRAYDDKGLVPDLVDGRGEKFFDDWYAFLKSRGVDFIKVDNQSAIGGLWKEKIPVSQAAAQSQKDLQKAGSKYFNNNMINCMDMNIETVYSFTTSNVGRSSGDFLSGGRPKPAFHILRNVMNSLWFSQLSYPDYDEFQTHDSQSEAQALLRAMSGGPIYFADEAGKERFELLWPLIFSDGRILRPDQPALPASDSLFDDPRFSPRALKHFATASGAGLVAAYNVNYSGVEVSGSYSPSDVHGIAGQSFAVFEHYSRELEIMQLHERRSFSLEKGGYKLWVAKPVTAGFAAIGLIDKLISPKAVVKEELSEGSAVITLYEGGEFLAYSVRRPRQVMVNEMEIPSELYSYENESLKIDLSRWKGRPVKLMLRF